MTRKSLKNKGGSRGGKQAKGPMSQQRQGQQGGRKAGLGQLEQLREAQRQGRHSPAHDEVWEAPESGTVRD